MTKKKGQTETAHPNTQQYDNIDGSKRQEFTEADREKRKRMILSMLEKWGPMTAREAAYTLGFTERNATAPRLTELERDGLVEVVSKKIDTITRKTVRVYGLAGGNR